ncbi:MAG: hypothetical protein Q4C63_09100 [Eubacteriales bacterium]|nr:hypothetical protein [Eubacteriales bacterium]
MKQLLDLLTWEPNLRMQYELLLMLVLFLAPAAFLKNTKRLLITWGLIFAAFLLLHGSFFPFVLAGAYCYVLCGLWEMVRTGSLRAFRKPYDGLWCGLVMLFPDLLQGDGAEHGKRGGRCLPAVILIVLLIQLNRIEIAADYDSLRYGLRSPYVLLGGKGLAGFFENFGLVNTVYTYSKGFELITLPLSLFSVYVSVSKSYAYVLCFNIWVLFGIFCLCGMLAARVTGKREAGAAAAFFCALMPGVTNMALTAKSDLLTLFFQLFFLYEAVVFICTASGEEAHAAARRAGLSAGGIAALLISYALKPTAMLFSSVLGLCTLLVLLWKGKKENRAFLPCMTRSALRLPLLAAAFTGLCWLRTFLLTGLPVTSVFSGIFTSLGFSIRYPFAAQAAPGTEMGMTFSEILRQFFERLFGFLFCPAGTDMEHVRMAWGGIAFVLLLFLILRFGRRAMGNLKAEAALTVFHYLLLMLVFVTAVSLVSLALLYQVDGNYYMLWYALTAVCGTAVFYALSMSGPVVEKTLAVSPSLLTLLAASMLYITAFTGWAGAVGFTPTGFQQDRSTRERHIEEGDYALWRMLSETGRGRENHVIAFADEPECYDLRCVAESYTDITGSGGNVYLVKKLNIFKEYLAFADVDYIYADREWLSLAGNERAAELLYDLAEDGTFAEIMYEADAKALFESEETHIFPETGAFETGASKTGEDAERYFAARIDKERVKQNWEEPKTPQQENAAKAALQKLGFAD